MRAEFAFLVSTLRTKLKMHFKKIGPILFHVLVCVPVIILLFIGPEEPFPVLNKTRV